MVSVIITTYGGSGKLKRAIESVLIQTYRDIEIIVVDDNDPTSDARKKTENIMSAYKNRSDVIYIQHEKNKNGASARNTGICIAKGEYIAFLDDDDIYFPKRIEQAVILCESQNAAGVCFGVVCIEDQCIVKLIQKPWNYVLKPDDLLVDANVIGTGSNIFMRTEYVQKVEGFDEDFQRFQDIEFMIRVSKEGIIIFSPEIMIIKDVSDARIPKYKKVKEALNIFNDKFKSEIENLSVEKKNIYLRERYEMLLVLAKVAANRREIDEVEQDMVSMGFLTKKENLLFTTLLWKTKGALKNGIFRKYYYSMKRQRNIEVDRGIKNIIGIEKHQEIRSLI